MEIKFTQKSLFDNVIASLELRLNISDKVKKSAKEILLQKAKFLKKLNETYLKSLVKSAIKIITLNQLNLSNTALPFTDTEQIDKNILTQTTYHKTLTKRP